MCNGWLFEQRYVFETGFEELTDNPKWVAASDNTLQLQEQLRSLFSEDPQVVDQLHPRTPTYGHFFLRCVVMTGREQQVAAAAALSLILQSDAVSLDQQTICSLLQTCHSWRAVVQGCNSSKVDIEFDLLYVGAVASFWPLMDKVTGLSHWIVKYAGLVSSISVYCPSSSQIAELWSFSKAAESLLYFSIQQAARGPATTAVNSGQQKPLQLRSFSSTELCGLDVITVLPAQQLTGLTLLLTEKNLPRFAAPCSRSSTAWQSALVQLTNLRTVDLCGPKDGIHDIPCSCITGLAQLQQLTSLRLLGISSEWGTLLQQLPITLRQLQLAFYDRGLEEVQGFVALDIQHLSQLTMLQLDVDYPKPFAPGTAMPHSLQTLNLSSLMHYRLPDHSLCNTVEFLQLSALKQLSTVKITVKDCGLPMPFYLSSLKELTQVQALELDYVYVTAALEASHSWDALGLPQLHGLTIGDGMHQADLQVSIGLMRAAVEGAAAAKNLTRLQIDCNVAHDGVDADFSVFQPLTALQKLQELIMDGFEWAPLQRMDALHLTCLRALTKLDFGSGCGNEAVGDVTAVALVCNLTNLQWLNLQSCGLSGMSVFPAIAAQLTDLQHLDLSDNDLDLQEQYLMMLTTLTDLTFFAPDCKGVNVFK